MQKSLRRVTYFAIIGQGDSLLYEICSRSGLQDSRFRDLRQFIVHAALDAVDERMWRESVSYLRCVDRYEEFVISAYLTFGPLKFILLQDTEPFDIVPLFFGEVHEICAKYMASPFSDPSQRIRSTDFDNAVRTVFNRHFPA